jgi:hypothetical protein
MGLASCATQASIIQRLPSLKCMDSSRHKYSPTSTARSMCAHALVERLQQRGDMLMRIGVMQSKHVFEDGKHFQPDLLTRHIYCGCAILRPCCIQLQSRSFRESEEWNPCALLCAVHCCSPLLSAGFLALTKLRADSSRCAALAWPRTRETCWTKRRYSR